MTKLKLSILPETFAVYRFSKDAPIPAWALAKKSFLSITRTNDELSIVAEEANGQVADKTQNSFRAIKILGPLDFSLTGILSSLATPLAAAKISIFTISTYDTDYILVDNKNLTKAKEVLGAFCDFI